MAANSVPRHANPERRPREGVRRGRGDVQDPALSSRSHTREDRLDQVKGSLEIHFEHQPAMTVGIRLHRTMNAGSRVVDEHLDGAAEELLGSRYDRRPAVWVGQIGRKGSDGSGVTLAARACDGQAAVEVVVALLCARRDHDLRTFRGEALCHSRSDTPAGTRDHRSASPECARRISTATSFRHQRRKTTGIVVMLGVM